MASLSQLHNDLNYWNGQVTSCNNTINKLKKRRTDVENVKNALRSAVNSNSSDVNDKLRSSGSQLDAAIDYAGKDSQLNAILSGKDEITLGSDNNLTSADGELQNELNAINRQLGEAENALNNAKRKVSETQSAIAAEERRRREEAAKK